MHKLLDLLLPTFGRAYYGKGRWDRYEKYKASRLFDYIDENFPPCFITDGNRISFEDQNKRLALSLENKGVKIRSLFFPRWEHGEVNHEYLFDMRLDVSKRAMKELLGFLNEA